MKIVNIILGLGTAIIVGALINLGIRAFYPEPQMPSYNIRTKAMVAPYPTPCAAGDKECVTKNDAYNLDQRKQQSLMQGEQQAYEARMRVYNSNLFIIANVAGIAIFIVGFWLLFSTTIAAQSVPIGIMMSGLYGIIYGYARGWGSTNDQLKFFVGLLVAALVIGGSIWLIDRYHKKRKK
ncbi:MAG: hypothetical protein Q8P49_03955 [Candidatus Liptonbacteria bacterium]|nr:hypothetical protein [Candidatus Liptonbacteria bacterium]